MTKKRNHSFRFQILALLLFSCLTAGLRAQSFNTRDLFGKWQSTNWGKTFELNIMDSSVLYMKAEGNSLISNMALTYSIDSIKNHTLLSIHYPNGFTMKFILWIKNNEEIRLFSVDIMNHNDPLKEMPEENSKKIMILKRVRNVI